MIHLVNQRNMLPPYEAHLSSVRLGMGCFWGAERLFWQQEFVWVTAAGYAGGERPNPSYQQVCSSATGHAEIVQVVFDAKQVRLEQILKVFWENHDPTQGMRQGNDIGSQYRSVIYTDSDDERLIAEQSRLQYQLALDGFGRGKITTEIAHLGIWYPAEDYHQQYLHKNPQGYCGLRGTGVVCNA